MPGSGAERAIPGINLANFEETDRVYGDPAIVAHRYGQGWAVLAGSLVSFAYFRTQDVGARAPVLGVCDVAGIMLPVQLRDDGGDATGLEAHLLENTRVPPPVGAHSHDRRLVAMVALVRRNERRSFGWDERSATA